MTKKDRLLAAFLVSMGLFSLAQAIHYVQKLPEKQKNALMPVMKDSARQRMLNNVCSQVLIHGDPKTTKVG